MSSLTKIFNNYIMLHSTIIGISFVNCPQDADFYEIMNFIDNSDGDFDTFSLAPKKPGTHGSACFDYSILLPFFSDVSSVINIAEVLWKAYEIFIEPKISNRDEEEGIGIYAALRKPDGTVYEFKVGNGEYSDKIIFIGDFTKKVIEYHKADGDEKFYTQSETEVTQSGIWIQRK